jgi:hypothetical protein
MAGLIVAVACLVLLGLLRFTFPAFREGTYRRGSLWYLRLGTREEIGLPGPAPQPPARIHRALAIASCAVSAAGLLAGAVVLWVGGYVVVAVLAGVLGLAFGGLLVDDLQENRFLRADAFPSTIANPLSVSDKQAAEIVARLGHDLRTTLGWGRGRAEGRVLEWVGRSRELEGEMDHRARTLWVAGQMRKELQDSLQDAAWPECPTHPGHALSLRVQDAGELVWACDRDDRDVAPFGSLGVGAGSGG